MVRSDGRERFVFCKCHSLPGIFTIQKTFGKFLLNIYYYFLAGRNSHKIFHSSFEYFMNEKFHVRLKET
jgi:hypothetical protein